MVRVGDPLAEQGVSGVSVPVVNVEAGRPAVLGGAGALPPLAMPEGIDVLDLSTREDYLTAVQALLERRERRHAH